MSLVFNMVGGGGGTGGTLTVNAPAGATVTVTNNEKTYTRTANSNGVAVFKGLASGTWYVSIDDADHDPTEPVTVEIVADYEVTVTFFAATINVTYPAGSTCKATYGSYEFTAPDTSGTWTLIVPSRGTWTIYATNGASEKTATVTITTAGENQSVTLTYTTYYFKAGEGQKVTFVKGNAANASVTVNNSYVYIQKWGDDAGHESYWLTSENQSLAGKTKIIIRAKCTDIFTASGNDWSGRFTVLARKLPSLNAPSALGITEYASCTPTANSTTKNYEIPVSNLNGSYSIGWWGCGTVYVYDMYSI